ncbi:hypothetical protein ACLK2D_08965 [Escherichia coli]
MAGSCAELAFRHGDRRRSGREVARVYGYNNIPDEPVQASLIMGTHREADLSLQRVKTLLNDKGYEGSDHLQLR